MQIPVPQGVSISQVLFNFTQDTDCCQDSNELCQSLTVMTQNGAVDDDDTFLVIETRRWAIDDPAEFASMLAGVLDTVRKQKGGA